MLKEAVASKQTAVLDDDISTNFTQCDKVGRDAGGKDPCSECRWFGGDDGGRYCDVAEYSSVNDALWKIMIDAWETEYTLPEQTHRLAPPETVDWEDYPPGYVKPPPTPMAEENVKADWQGKSKEELLNTPSWIPSDMREHPRAYLVPARNSDDEEFSQAQGNDPSNRLNPDIFERDTVEDKSWLDQFEYRSDSE